MASSRVPTYSDHSVDSSISANVDATGSARPSVYGHTARSAAISALSRSWSRTRSARSAEVAGRGAARAAAPWSDTVAAVLAALVGELAGALHQEAVLADELAFARGLCRSVELDGLAAELADLLGLIDGETLCFLVGSEDLELLRLQLVEGLTLLLLPDV